MMLRIALIPAERGSAANTIETEIEKKINLRADSMITTYET